ncbi:MAG: hypothetical protein N3B21_19345 [Clostridia bacterium]|nr:hypothetical protein [Clostridia bacterium]
MNHNFFKVEKFDFDIVMETPNGEIMNKCYTASSKGWAENKARTEFPENTILMAVPLIIE